MSNSATSMACAACIAVAATLPWAGSAAERLATEDMRLAAITDIDAFSAIPLYRDILFGTPMQRAAAIAALDSVNGLPALLAFLGGNPNRLFGDDTNAGYDALSAIDIFFGDGANATGGVISDGNFDGLANYDALSALPVFRDVLTATTPTEAIDALEGYDALSALPIFFGSEGLITTGNLDALADYDALSAIPVFAAVANADTPTEAIDALAGYDALSALPVFFGSNGVISTGNLSSLAPDAAGNGGYAALSAIPKYLNLPTNPAPPTVTTFTAQAQVAQDPAPTTTTPSTGSNPVKTFVAALPKPTLPAPQVFTPPAPPKEEPAVEAAAATTPDTGGTNVQNAQRNSPKFTPKGIDGQPILFGSGTPGVDNGIRGWGDGLKKLGIGGGDASADGSGTG